MLSEANFNAGEIETSGEIRTFFDNLNIVTRNFVGTPRFGTKSMICDLLYLVKLNNYPLKIE